MILKIFIPKNIKGKFVNVRKLQQKIQMCCFIQIKTFEKIILKDEFCFPINSKGEFGKLKIVKIVFVLLKLQLKNKYQHPHSLVGSFIKITKTNIRYK